MFVRESVVVYVCLKVWECEYEKITGCFVRGYGAYISGEHEGGHQEFFSFPSVVCLPHLRLVVVVDG